MVVAPVITWLLVTTSPFGVMIIPVPWSSCSPPLPPPPPPKPPPKPPLGAGEVASMETTAGSTLAITVSMLVVPLSSAGPIDFSLMVVLPPLPPWSVAATMPPPMRAPMRAATTTRTAHLARPRRGGGACRRRSPAAGSGRPPNWASRSRRLAEAAGPDRASPLPHCLHRAEAVVADGGGTDGGVRQSGGRNGWR